jgi:ArsR family transcriptional regulator, arsenate/arsenite/antimonite-responsive transcriptional repressor
MKNQKAFDPELFFSALADRTRLRLLNLMRGGEVCVCYFAETLGTNNPKISRHLAYLRRASLVAGRRQGKWMHYSITPPADAAAAKVFDFTLAMLAADKQMGADRSKLIGLRRSPEQLVKIDRRGKAQVQAIRHRPTRVVKST